MEIAVLGAGAIGSYFGALLARSGANVTLIGRPAHVEAINRNGLLFRSGSAEQRVAVAATTDIAAVRNARLVLFCVKSLDTDRAAQEMAPHLAPDAIILSLQNGVDNPERIRSRMARSVIAGLVYAGANIPAPGIVNHTGGGSVVIGESRERQGTAAGRDALKEIAALFSDAGLSVRISDDIAAELWTKLLMNCAYNAISALGQSPYGRMAAMPEVNRIMRAAAEEVAAVAKAKGIRLPDDIVESAMKLVEAMPHTMSSTAQDIAHGRPTEISHLNGYVVRQGVSLGIATPVNQTLDALVKLLEQSRRGAPQGPSH